MKRVPLLLLAAILWSYGANGQRKSNPEATDTTATETFRVVDKSASFPGGLPKFYEKYISKNMKYPKDAKEMGVEGRVLVEFVIEATGAIRQESVQVVKGIHPSCDGEAVRLIKLSPKWTPAFSTELNKNVAQKFIVPIIFKL